MTLIADIKLAQLEARKARNSNEFSNSARVKAALLTTLIGECETLAKNSGHELTDAQVVVVLKKFLKNAEESIQHTLGLSQLQMMSIPVDKLGELREECTILKSFLPQQLTEGELRALINDFANQGKDIGDAMKSLKTQFAGRYDGALASKLMKELL